MDTQYNIADLAAAAGISSRAVRFYVQQGLLDPPTGLGRGSHYTDAHLARLRDIQNLQRAGHSLAAIKAMAVAASAMAEGIAPPPPAPPAETNGDERPAAGVLAELVSRVTIAPGVTLEYDVTKYNPSAEGLLALRALAREVFGRK